jgi:hypothetical protein
MRQMGVYKVDLFELANTLKRHSAEVNYAFEKGPRERPFFCLSAAFGPESFSVSRFQFLLERDAFHSERKYSCPLSSIKSLFLLPFYVLIHKVTFSAIM